MNFPQMFLWCTSPMMLLFKLLVRGRRECRLSVRSFASSAVHVCRDLKRIIRGNWLREEICRRCFVRRTTLCCFETSKKICVNALDHELFSQGFCGFLVRFSRQSDNAVDDLLVTRSSLMPYPSTVRMSMASQGVAISRLGRVKESGLHVQVRSTACSTFSPF